MIEKSIPAYFPYEPREDQEKIYKQIKDFWGKRGKHVFLDAYTGMGKTILALTLAYSEIKDKKKQKIVYFCRTKEQTSRVVQELKLLEKLQGIVLRSRNEMCFDEEISKNDDPLQNQIECYQKRRAGECKYYNNIDNENVFNLEFEELIDFCKEKEICPYHANLKRIAEANIITVCYANLWNRITRNILFKRLKGFKLFFIFDEGHEWLDFPEIDPVLMNFEKKSIDKIELIPIKRVVSLFRKMQENRIELLNQYGEVEIFEGEIQDVCEEIENIFQLEEESLLKELWYQGQIHLSHKEFVLYRIFYFLQSFYRFRKSKVHFYSMLYSDQGHLLFSVLYTKVHTFYTKFAWNKAIVMSGTLDIESLVSIMRLKDCRQVLELNLPYNFPLENRILRVMAGMSTYSKQRNDEMFEKLARVIEKTLNGTKINTGVFFTSFSMLNTILDLSLAYEKGNKAFSYNFMDKIKGKVIFREIQGEKAQENSIKINSFKKSENAVWFGVMGGRNSEGISFNDKEMEILLLIGIPIPPPSIRNEMYKKGYGYVNVYLRPTIRRLRQTIGRIIRSETDKGFIIVCDSRFAFQNKIKNFLPVDLKKFEIIQFNHYSKINKEIKEFFDSEPFKISMEAFL